ncbi:MAG: CopD family protein [Bacteroidia bacterium]
MNISYVKALHIIFVVCWFAGLFYIVRLFIYQVEAKDKPEPERSILVNQFRLMQRRLWYGITWPSAVLTFIFGWWMYFTNFDYFIVQPWMHLKLLFVGLLAVYHIKCHMIFLQQRKDIYRFTSLKLRIWNEVATALLFAIVFLVVVKSSGGFIWGMLALAGLTAVLLLGIYVYKKNRLKNEQKESDHSEKDSPGAGS